MNAATEGRHRKAMDKRANQRLPHREGRTERHFSWIFERVTVVLKHGEGVTLSRNFVRRFDRSVVQESVVSMYTRLVRSPRTRLETVMIACFCGFPNIAEETFHFLYYC
jgi:hypothetical protein